jgi:hypothetical protein
VRPVARALLVADRPVGEPVVIRERGHQRARALGQRGDASVAEEPLVARHFHQNVVEAERQAEAPIHLAGAGDDRGGAIELFGLGADDLGRRQQRTETGERGRERREPFHAVQPQNSLLPS